MQTVNYKRDTLYKGLIGVPILTAALVFGALTFGGALLTIFAVIFVFACPVLVFVQWKALNGDGIALRYDDKGITIATLYKRTYAPWSDIRRIHSETLQQKSAFGLIKQDLAHYIVFTTGDKKGGLDTWKVQTDLLDIPRRSDEALLDAISVVWSQTVPGVGTVAAAPKPGLFGMRRKEKPRDPLEGAPRTDDFDPDAIMARYMANREQVDIPPPATSARPSFGRKLA